MGHGCGPGGSARTRLSALFDGVLHTDTASAAAAEDFGHIVDRRPLAVLEPGSVDDIVRLIGFAGRLRIGVAARGQGHSAYGQAQADAGVVIDMRALAGVHDVDGSFADVDAGRHWTRHFGDSWPALVRAKRRYDPARILTPGQHVFR